MKILDERSHDCPIPVVNTISELKNMAVGDVVCVKVSKDVQVENLKKMADTNKFAFESKKVDDYFEVIITKTNNDMANVDTCSCGCGDSEKNSAGGDMVVVISGNTMGSGAEELGKNLIKAFIFALTKQDKLPEKIMFYNSGAYLTTEGSDSLNDLYALEKSGVKIYTCGTCLDYYGLKDKLKVGEVTNMYDIVSNIEKANMVIRP